MLRGPRYSYFSLYGLSLVEDVSQASLWNKAHNEPLYRASIAGFLRSPEVVEHRAHHAHVLDVLEVLPRVDAFRRIDRFAGGNVVLARTDVGNVGLEPRECEIDR